MSDISFTTPDFGSNPVQYLKEVRVELKKVQWPTREQIVRATILVFSVSLVVGSFLGGMDYIFTQVFGLLLQR